MQVVENDAGWPALLNLTTPPRTQNTHTGGGGGRKKKNLAARRQPSMEVNEAQ